MHLACLTISLLTRHEGCDISSCALSATAQHLGLVQLRKEFASCVRQQVLQRDKAPAALHKASILVSAQLIRKSITSSSI